MVFTCMTQMHERYAFAALVFLILLIAEARIRWLALALGVVFTLNLWRRCHRHRDPRAAALCRATPCRRGSGDDRDHGPALWLTDHPRASRTNGSTVRGAPSV